MKLIKLFLFISLCSCSSTEQRAEIPFKDSNGNTIVLKTINRSISVLNKNAVARMANAAGEIDGIVTDSTGVPKDISNTVLGIEAIQGMTEVTKIMQGGETKRAISTNKKDVSLKKIETGGEVKKAMIQKPE